MLHVFCLRWPCSLTRSSKLCLVGLVFLVLLVLPFVLTRLAGPYSLRILDFALLYVFWALGLHFLVGELGLLHLGYSAFCGIGAYTAALLGPQLPPSIAGVVILLAAALFAGLFGLLQGLATLHLRRDYFALTTLGFAEVLRFLINNLDYPVNLTNGPKGISNIAALQFFGLDFGVKRTFLGITLSQPHYYYGLLLILVGIAMVLCQRLRNSRLGRAWVAIREDELAARSLGVNSRACRLIALVLAAAMAGIGGAIFATFQGFVSPDSFNFWESVVILACVVLGGVGHWPGAAIGALLLILFPEFLRVTLAPLQGWLFGYERFGVEVVRQLVYGVAMVLMMRYRPAGLWPASAADSN